MVTAANVSFAGNGLSLTYTKPPDSVQLRATLEPGTSDEWALRALDQCSASPAWQPRKSWTG